MSGIMQMLSVGWPLALIGFALGALVGVRMARPARDDGPHAPLLEHGEDGMEVLAAELKAAKEMLAAEGADNEAAAETLTALDEAIKRANGRLKLIAKAVKKTK